MKSTTLACLITLTVYTQAVSATGAGGAAAAIATLKQREYQDPIKAQQVEADGSVTAYHWTRRDGQYWLCLPRPNLPDQEVIGDGCYRTEKTGWFSHKKIRTGDALNPESYLNHTVGDRWGQIVTIREEPGHQPRLTIHYDW